MAALGAFQLVSDDPRLGDYFEPGEIATFKDLDDCAAKIRHFLAHPAERLGIAARGQARARRDHGWERRWEGFFAPLEVSHA